MFRCMRSSLALILACCFLLTLVSADQRIGRLQRRQDNSDAPPTSNARPRTSSNVAPVTTASRPIQTGSNGEKEGVSSSADREQLGKTSQISSGRKPNSNSTITSSSATASAITISAVTSNINGPAETSSYNLAQYNSTATPDLLPIVPEITPGFAVGGVILMLSGIVYTLIGIKNKWLHIFLSAAYLSSLSVTVLIVYVMNPPVSNAVQGAYLVAIVMTGLILGGAATVFTEMTEGLGCLLGGFCFSMWLLVLKPGGLITSTGGKAIFITSFTLASFATSFSHYTRDRGLIVTISFAGATTVVLGIDCFSRAGLKEFWVYLWDLNTNLFPVGATSYPLTRGMKVEIAAIVVLFLAGIVSQMKLWKVIKEKREQRAAVRLEDERTTEREEENVGRRIETGNARDRDQWEAVYGDKNAISATANPSNRDSGVGDMDSQNKGARSTVTSIRRSGEEGIEMSQLQSPTLTTGAGLVMTYNGQEGGPVTVRVARDLEPLTDIDENRTFGHQKSRLSHVSTQSSRAEPAEEEKTWVVGTDGEARLERRPSRAHSKRASNPQVSEVPKVVPLPFQPPTDTPEEAKEADDRSSIATFADEEDDFRKRTSRHLSAGSAILRKFSGRSQRSQRDSRTFSKGEGASTEDLVIPRAADNDDDRASSVAATMDGLSDDADFRSIRSSYKNVPDTDEGRTPDGTVPTITRDGKAIPSTPTLRIVTDDGPEEASSRSLSDATEATNILDADAALGDSSVKRSLTSSTDPKAKVESTLEVMPEEPNVEEQVEKNDIAPTVVSAVESKQASITKERLPPQLSKVVMTYRTNEWAKHLSNAENPEVEELKMAEYPVESNVTASEIAAPVDMVALQQTAENAPLPLASRPGSQMSNHPNNNLLLRPGSAMSNQSRISYLPYLQRPETLNGVMQDGTLFRSMSQQSLQRPSTQPNLSKGSFRNSSTLIITQPIVESPIEEANFESPTINQEDTFSPQMTPYGSTSTLIGKRDSILRSKNSYFGNGSALASTPELPSPYHQSGPNSDAGSVYTYPNNSSPMTGHEDDNMSLSARRTLIRQSSLNIPQSNSPSQPPNSTLAAFDSHQPRRQSSTPTPAAREQQLASWRANVAQDLQSSAVPKNTIERSRSALLQERQAEEYKKSYERRVKGERDHKFDERMRRGDMLDAHREALRRMQAGANKNV